MATKMMIVLLDETDTAGDVPLYEAIVRRLAQLGIAGATVQTGIMGYGKRGHLHRKRLFGISDDRPVTIVAVDSEEKLRSAAANIRNMMKEGVVLLTDVELIGGA